MTMTTYNDQVNSPHIAAYLADVTSALGNSRRSTGLLSALRSYRSSVISRSRARLRTGNGLEADTRQIRSFDLSKCPGACEVRLGFRLAI